MFTRLTVVFVAVLALCATAVAEDQITELQPGDNGLLGAMKRMGCQPQWLGAVMRESSILESELTSLRAGRLLVLPGGCGGAAPEAVRETTKRIFARQAIFARALEVEAELEPENKRLQEEARGLKYRLDETVSANRDLAGQVTDLTLRLQRAGAAVGKAGALSRIVSMFGIGGVIAVSQIWLFFLSLERRRRKMLEAAIAQPLPQPVPPARNESEDAVAPVLRVVPAPVFSIKHHGNQVTFRNTSPDASNPRAGCPHCPEKNLVPRAINLRQHLDKVHPYLSARRPHADAALADREEKVSVAG